MSRVPPWKLIVIVLVAVICTVAAAPSLRFAGLFSWGMGWVERYPEKKLTLGLDLQGGLDMVFRVDSKSADRLKDDMIKAVEILRNRIDLHGVKEATIQQQGDDQIRVQIPGLSDKEQKEVKDLLKTTDLLTFKLLRPNGESLNVFELTSRKGPEDEIVQHIPEDKPGYEAPWYLLKKEAEIGGDSLTHARIGFDSLRGEPKILLEFNDEGTKKFGEITERLVGQRLAIVLGGKVYMAPVIKHPIKHGQAEITGRFDIEEARKVTSILKAGALPAPLIKLAENTVGPTLGKESITYGIQAAMVGLLLVVIFMVVWYKGAGLLADVALIMDAVMVVAFLLFFDATLTLPGIAGLILTIGMAVDANVIIFERLKEELKLGKTVRAAIDAGFDKAFVTILDSNLTTLLTAIVLYVFGTGPVRGFAVTLSIGILVSMFTALFVVKVLMDLVYGSAKTVSI